ncbi:MAG: hypothetical protein HC844_06055, partial [Tabrizicola sp.]|nr:hypothetical protein [Tabrizicola sp.]
MGIGADSGEGVIDDWQAALAALAGVIEPRVEEIFWRTCEKILRITRNLDYVPDDLEHLERDLADTYFMNFSVFQSLPDSWAIRQLFPVLPVHRLAEEPTRRAV